MFPEALSDDDSVGLFVVPPGRACQTTRSPLGGEYRARLFSCGWEDTGRIEACEPPRRLLLVIKHGGEADEQVIEISLAAVDDQTIVVWEERGMPLDLLSAYGAGVQIHVEDLADHLAGRERRGDAKARWDELHPAYQDLAAKLS